MDSEGTVFKVFDQHGSGCLSCGVETAGGERLFVKTSTTVEAEESLKRAVRLHRKVSHPVLVPLTEAFMDVEGSLTLIYPWCEGRPVREHLAEFHGLPVAVRAEAVSALLDVHLAIVAAGFVAVDLYDGCFLYDFDRHEMRLIDIDEYRPGPFVVEADRMPGSRRYMAPEEFRRGATIDERTTVYNLGRAIQILLGDQGLLARATDPEPERRFPTVAALVAAWHQAGLESDDH